ncbi:MAG TPA: TRAP transporter TatT component family protein [Gammaproteobacteria bacterium]|nr:TRAP transporter TatT component family protein [Gammaproteobacteria bacterium]
MSRSFLMLAGGVLLASLSACSSMIGSMAASTLSDSILNQRDPELVRHAVPAYLLLIDGMIYEHPDNENLLAAAAQLYALYGSRFALNHDRAVALTSKAHRYGTEALCLEHQWACKWDGSDYDGFVKHLTEVTRKQVGLLYAYAVGWLAYLDATSEDWSAVAELPWVQASLERVIQLDGTYQHGTAHEYLGILYSLRPPALGGQPEKAKQEFEQAIELSGGRDLSVKVEYARRYARLVFDRKLHDRLLDEVLAAPVEAKDLTLFNVLAKQEAKQLLDSADDYF